MTPRIKLQPKVVARQKMERDVIHTAVRSLIQAGFWLRVWDSEEFACRHTRDERIVMRAIGSVDMERIYVYRKPEETFEATVGSLLLIYGNDGFDVIADNSVSLEPYLVDATALAERLSLTTM